MKRVGGAEVLEIVEAPPCPAPAKDEVLVEMRAIGLNRSDVAFRSGKYLIPPDPPCGLGIEGSGTVLAVGAKVEKYRAGERVCVLPGFPQGGAYATYATHALFPASSLIATPDKLSDVEAAALWISTLTAWGALIELGGLGKGDFVLISAASSSIGLAAIQVAKAVQAVPIATTRNPAKAEALRKAGAAHVVVANGDVSEPVLEITGSAGLRLAFDPVAGPFVESLVPCMAEEGLIFVYGGLSDEPTMFDRRPIISKGIKLAGYMVGQILRRPDRLARGERFIRDHLNNGAIAPHVDRVFAFEKVIEAHRYMESNQQVGKIVLAAV